MTGFRRPQLPGRYFGIYALIFMCIWLPGMTTVLTAKPCFNAKYEQPKRLRFCNFSIAMARFTVFATEGHKMATIYMERGVLLANKGETEAAQADMQRALALATAGVPAAELTRLRDQVARLAESTAPDADAQALRNNADWDHRLTKLFLRVTAPDASEHAQKTWDDTVTEALRTGARAEVQPRYSPLNRSSAA